MPEYISYLLKLKSNKFISGPAVKGQNLNLNCDFEQNFCGWNQAAGGQDNLNWGRQVASAASHGNGPRMDHTVGTSGV